MIHNFAFDIFFGLQAKKYKVTKDACVILVVIFCLVSYYGASGQQQQMYTQFMYNKLSLNPAFAGNEKYATLALLYRDQWSGFPGAPEGQLLSVNLPRIGNRIGLGLNFERQTIGISEKITYEGIYAYKFSMGEGTLSMGMNVSGRYFRQDFTDERIYSVQDRLLDPSIPNTVQTNSFFNAGFGVYFNTNTFYLGMSLPRMIRSDIDFDNNQSFSTESRHLLLMTGGTFILDQDLRLTPQMLFKVAEHSPWSLDLNLSATIYDKYTTGLTYRTGGASGDLGESLDVIIGMQLSDRMMIGFAYDITLAQIRTVSNGSAEIIMNYNFIPKRIKTILINPRYF